MKLNREQLKRVLAVSRGAEAADILIRKVQYLDLINGGTMETSIVIAEGTIAGVGTEYDDALALQVIEGQGLTAVPGFIDAHLHVESSMMNPFEFERVTLPKGTTSIVCDPHEIANVMGVQGTEWFLRCSELADQNQFIQISSCVPALQGMETNFGEITCAQMAQLKDHPSVLGMGEMMNFPGVINGDDKVLDKIELFSGKSIDGHSPLLQGKGLCAYIAAGVENCHETVSVGEGIEKMRLGMGVMIREGTVAKNLRNLAPMINEFNSLNCMLCTDDRNPLEIAEVGHIDSMIRFLIQEQKLAPHLAYRLATYSPARHFGLKHLGLIAPGKQADIILLADINTVKINSIILRGRELRTYKLDVRVSEKLKKSLPPLANSMVRTEVNAKDFYYNFSAGEYRVMGLIPGELITQSLIIAHDGKDFIDHDVVKIAVIERYGKQTPISIGLVKGFGLIGGAMASSVAHDCHNIIVMGRSDEDMATAVNHLIHSGGGQCIVSNGNVVASLPLSIGGLMSVESSEEIIKKQKQLHHAHHQLGVKMEAPFLNLAFLALPVIPSLKITDRGLFDITTFSFYDLKV